MVRSHGMKSSRLRCALGSSSVTVPLALLADGDLPAAAVTAMCCMSTLTACK